MRKNSKKSTRLGLSTAELLGCLLAVAGGAWIGANYLGVNLNHVAYVALDESDLLDQVPEDWRPEEPSCPVEEDSEFIQQRRLAFDDLTNQRQTILNEINKRRSETGWEAFTLPAALPLSDNASSDENSTASYWRQLVLFVDDVSAMERETMSLEASGKLADSHHIRSLAMNYAQHGLELLPSRDVDEAALQTAGRLANWFKTCQEHAEQGSEVAKKLAGGHLPLKEKKSWDQANVQLSMQADLLLRKLEETRAALQSEYSTEFAPIQPLGTALTR